MSRVWPPLNERQLNVLNWIAAGCPDGVWEDFTYKTVAIALQNRHLAVVTKRRGQWRAEVTDAGKYYWDNNAYPPPSAADHGASSPRSKATARSTPQRPPRTPEPADTTAPAESTRKTSSAKARPTVTEQLVADVIAAGGTMLVKERYGPGAPNWRARVTFANRNGKVPQGKRLVHKNAVGGLEIRLVDIPAWELLKLDPIPVPGSLRKPHAVVAGLRDGPRSLDITKAVLPRALRLVQALVNEAEHRGMRVQAGKKHHDRREHRRSESQEHFSISTQGHSCGIRVVQLTDRIDHEPTARELGNAQRHSWVRIAKHDYVPSHRLSIEMPGPFAHHASSWTDGPTSPLEESLAQIIHEIELRAAAAERKRVADENAAAERQRRWEVAMCKARVAFEESHRASLLERQERAWRRGLELGEYLRAARERIDNLEAGSERSDAEAWLAWAEEHVRRTNPLEQRLAMPSVPEPTNTDLEPFLDGWSPWGPR